MRKRKNYRGTILLIGLAVLVFVTALRGMPEKDDRGIIDKTEEASAISTSKEVYLEKNSAVKLKTVYNCGHIKTSTSETDENMIGKTKKEIETMHPDWKINEFTSNFLAAEKAIEAPCENHYVIKLKNDTLYVYKKNNLTESIREQKINNSVLTENDIKELENGINADTEFEVLEILESFVS